jgi:multimeric flavodoxin WrbA
MSEITNRREKMNIIAINGSPRSGWNTDILVREAARGAMDNGANVEIFDLYKLEKYTGCVSCFLCKTKEYLGKCVYKDGLAPILEKIRNADGLILGSPIYLGDITAGLRSLYERLIFQSISYKTEPRSYNTQRMAIGLIITSNCPETMFPQIGYDQMIERYLGQLEAMYGSCELLVSDDTLQVNDYEPFQWTMFDTEKKKVRREEVFPKHKQSAYEMGKKMTYKQR